MDSRLTTHTHRMPFYLSRLISLPIIKPPIWQRPPVSIMANNSVSPLFTPSISISIWHLHGLHTQHTHTLLYTLGDTFRDAGLSLTPTSHLVLLFSPALHMACVLCLRFALLYSLPHFLSYSLSHILPLTLHILMHYSLPFHGINSVSSVCTTIIISKSKKCSLYYQMYFQKKFGILAASCTQVMQLSLCCRSLGAI